jgi:N-acetylglucosaminyldiphosphoundecaprenol N-acetyl-beta-D-mannosaminyltransferase
VTAIFHGPAACRGTAEETDLDARWTSVSVQAGAVAVEPAPSLPTGGPATFRFGRLELAPLAPAAASEWILDRASRGQTAVVVTSNINHLRLAELDGGFRDVLRRSELNVSDGWPLGLASRMLGRPIPGRVAGIDLVDSVLAAGRPLRVAILGGPPGAADGLARRCGRAHDVCMVDELPKGCWEADDALEALRARLRRARPNLTLVGLGPPRQELLAESLRSVVSGPILCCGASIEVLAGMTPRAPEYLQRVGLEWAFRLALEPRRLFRRYVLSGGCFLRVLVRELVSNGGRREDER